MLLLFGSRSYIGSFSSKLPLINRYESGKIYNITNVGYNKYCIGSTCESLSKRMERHRKHEREYTAGKTRKQGGAREPKSKPLVEKPDVSGLNHV